MTTLPGERTIHLKDDHSSKQPSIYKKPSCLETRIDLFSSAHRPEKIKIDSFTFDPEIPLVRLFRSPISSDIGESKSLSDQTLEEEEEIIIYTPPEGMNQQQQGFDQFTA
ncbi:hypothetical protein Glove_530g12 [Diversispora epigaea]|uniref:Uncharacterized protein n=1 Tax=Diversispora epigaea TaxID=1348612 RepID=A0A397GHC7_9GLOM|nr:hypothetical protein Glove_530g12 [Diversispora epigaea]